MTKKTLNDWLDYANQLHPKTIALGFNRLLPVAQKLDLLPVHYPVITVAGTNGKGSCVTLLESIYRAENYRVCTVTSPELLKFNERLTINGVDVSDETFSQACQLVDIARGNITLTFFEFTILASLVIIKQHSPDIAILEIGLGGRYDAVNVVDPDLAVITSIDLDHTEILGDNRDSIGKEKAGILRKKIPFIYGEPCPPQSIINEAARLQNPSFYQGVDFHWREYADHWQWICNNKIIDNLPVPRISLQNAATALMAVEAFQSTLSVSPQAIIQGLKNVFIPGRFQTVKKEFTLIFDVAHNPASARLLATNLQKQICTGKTFAIFSILHNKDIENTINPLRHIVNEWHIAGMEDLPRGLPIADLKNTIETLKLPLCWYHTTLKSAYQQVQDRAMADDRVVVYGSFHTVSAIMQHTC